VLLILPAVVVGVVLRLWGIRDQILIGDELHALASAVRWGLGRILTTYRVADHCIPMASYDRVLITDGVPMTEVLLRLPALVAGIASLLVLPMCAPLLVERRSAVPFAWFLALSPLLVFYSRFARPYAVVVLLGFVALVSFWVFWRGGRARWGGVFAVTAAAAVWFHPAAGPFVAAPLLYAFLDLARSGRWRMERRRLLRLGIVTVSFGLLVAAFLVPAAASFFRILERKSGSRAPTVSDMGEALWLLTGSGSAWVAVALAALALCGLGMLLRRRSRVALYTLLPIGCLSASLFVVRPYLLQVPAVLSRYLLIALPLVLLWAACGAVALWEDGSGWTGAIRRVALGAVMVGAVATHPHLADPALRFGPFAGTLPSLAFNRPSPELPAALVPLPYRVIAGEPGKGAVAEVADGVASRYLRAQLALWRRHGRRVIEVLDHPAVTDPRVTLRTVVPPDKGRIEESGARFVVVHRNRQRLERIIGRMGRGLSLGDVVARVPAMDPDAPEIREAERMAARFMDWWGEASLQGPSVRIWDLDGGAAGRVQRVPTPVAEEPAVGDGIGSEVAEGPELFDVTRVDLPGRDRLPLFPKEGKRPGGEAFQPLELVRPTGRQVGGLVGIAPQVVELVRTLAPDEDLEARTLEREDLAGPPAAAPAQVVDRPPDRERLARLPAPVVALEERKQGPARRRGDHALERSADHLRQGRRQVDELDQVLDPPGAPSAVARVDQQRHPKLLVVEVLAVALVPVVAEPFAMVRGNHPDGGAVEAEVFEALRQPLELPVDGQDLTVVGVDDVEERLPRAELLEGVALVLAEPGGELRAVEPVDRAERLPAGAVEALGHVPLVDVEEVEPEEEGAGRGSICREPLEPREPLVDDPLRRPVGLRHRCPVEPLAEGAEEARRGDRRRGVPLRGGDGRQGDEGGVEGLAVFEQPVLWRMEAGEDRGVAGGGVGAGRDRPLEGHPLVRQLGQERGHRPRVAVARQVVRPQGVDGDEDDPRGWRWRGAGRTGAEERDERQAKKRGRSGGHGRG